MSSPAFAIPPDLTRDTGAWPGDGPIKFGTDEHKRLLCKTLLDTHDPNNPAVLGDGVRIFDAGGFSRLRLLGSKAYACGVVVNRYAPAM